MVSIEKEERKGEVASMAMIHEALARVVARIHATKCSRMNSEPRSTPSSLFHLGQDSTPMVTTSLG